MQFADQASIPFRDPGTRHREGGIRFKYLLRGVAGSPQNYELAVVRTEGRFYSPAHRHNFDQMRWVLSGSFGDPRGMTLRAGELGYYPEGTPYRIDCADSELLLLQFGGASGAGFTHYDALRTHYPILATRGEFHDGVFRWHEPPPGTARQQDGYEALWELINGRKLTYPRQRYRRPVLMNPAGFDWVTTSPAVSVRRLGRFTERDIGAEQLRIAAGAAARLSAGPTIRLLYVLEGSGQIAGRTVHGGCALELLPGSDVPAAANDTLVLLALDLPRFDDLTHEATGSARAAADSTA